MKRLLYLAALSMVVMLLFAPTALAQTVETVPLNPDGTCPEGFVTVNAPFCAQESPNTPGRIFGYGEGDLTAPAQYEQYAPEGPMPVEPVLPATGGPAFLLPLSAGLILAGGLAVGLLRRR